MTEEQWLASTNLASMLEAVSRRLSPCKVSQRKLLLFTGAFNRSLYGSYSELALLREAEEAECLADGLEATEEYAPENSPRSQRLALSFSMLLMAAFPSLRDAANTLLRRPLADPKVFMLRDIVGNPFRPCSPLTDSDCLIKNAAQAAYEERDLPSGHLQRDRLLVLADMLEERGLVGDSELLRHLRGDGPHWRGCWGIDLVLGRS